MKVPFSATNLGFLGDFQFTIAPLAGHGHQARPAHLVTDLSDTTDGMQRRCDLVAAHPTITCEISPPVKRRSGPTAGCVVHLMLEDWRHLEPWGVA